MNIVYFKLGNAMLYRVNVMTYVISLKGGGAVLSGDACLKVVMEAYPDGRLNTKSS